MVQSIEKALRQARKYELKGEILSAIATYRMILDKFPKNKKAIDCYKKLNANLASGHSKNTVLKNQIAKLLNLYNRGQFLELIKQSKYLLSSSPNSFIIWNLVGAAYMGLDQSGKAEVAFRKAILINQNYPDAFNNLGTSLRNQNKLGEAVDAIKRAISIKPDYAAAFDNLGLVFQDQKKITDAAASHRSAISFKPNYAEAHFNLGNVMQKQKNFDLAVTSFKKAISLKPNYVKAHNNMGLSLQELGKVEEAEGAFKTAVSLQPHYFEAINNLGLVLQSRGRFHEAIGKFRKVIQLNPIYAEAFNNTGVALKDLGKIEEAIESYDDAIKIKPDFSTAHHNLGVAYTIQKQFLKAVESFENAISINPNDAEAFFGLSLAYLTRLEFDNGFKFYEWRWKQNNFSRILETSQPIWQSEQNKRVLIWPEQGIGDEIMFASLISDLYPLCSKLIVQVDKRLISLFERSFPSDIIFQPKNERVPEADYDFYIPMGSLPLHFRKTLDCFKASSRGYLMPDKVIANKLRSDCLKEGKKTVIGISWHSNSRLTGGRWRNLQLLEIAQALQLPEVQLISLQYGNFDTDIQRLGREQGIEVKQFVEIDNKDDLDGLSTLISVCDQVVSIDNATVHLAGALGIKTKVLLPFSSDWRWGVNQTSSYWYEPLSLYRQTNFGDWQEVLSAIKKDLITEFSLS